MATGFQTGVQPAGPEPIAAPTPPPLRQGDRLTRPEFERRYGAMPDCKKAELIEGIVYTPSPVSLTGHGRPDFDLTAWLGVYSATTPGIEGAGNSTVRLDGDNEPQPDVFLRILPKHGGATRDDGKYIAGCPELVAEVAASSVSYDLHQEKDVYRRHSVQEYLVWRVEDAAVDWFTLDKGHYKPLPPSEDGVLRSRVFPGLWLNAPALLAGDMAKVLAVGAAGATTDEHANFIKRLTSSRP